jgi:hypothetical protein
MKRCLSLLIAACGGGSSSPADDAGNPGVDAPDPSNVTITAHLLDRTGRPDPEAVAVFYDETNTVVSHGIVDADGKAHAFLPNGGSVTVVRRATSGSDTNISLISIRDVRPGDDLMFSSRQLPEDTLTGVQDTMVVSYDAPDNSGVAMLKPCSGPLLASGVAPGPVFAPATGILVFYEGCTTPTFDMLAMTQGSSRQFVWMPDIPYVGGGGVTVPNTWQPMSTLATTFENVSGTPQLAIFVSMLVGPWPFEMNRGNFPVSPASPSVAHQWAPGAGRGAVVQVFPFTGVPGETEKHVVIDPDAVSEVTIDLAALPLPALPQQATQSATGVTWTEQGAPAGDARFVNWRGRLADATGTRRFFYNTIENPQSGTGTSEILPLPDDYTDRDPTKVFPTALTLAGASVSYVDYSDLGGYDDARRVGPALFEIELAYHDGARHIHRTTSPQPPTPF